MPTEERYQQRFIETIFSTIFGVSIQRQTPEVQEKWANRLENHLRREEYRQRRDDGGSSSGSGSSFAPTRNAPRG
jgi:hypothetical protein